MKLFELTWRILCGEYEFTRRELRAFRSIRQADAYGAREEYVNNTGQEPKRRPSEKALGNAQESACWKFGWSYRFNGANEFRWAESDHGLYEVYLGGRRS